MDKLTVKQQVVFDFICSHIDETGFPPTRMEISDELGFKSPNAAEDHLKALERKGAIKILRGTSRGIRLLGKPPEGVPLVGQVAAGAPILAEENIVTYHHVSPTFFNPKADYLLEVKGVSMIKAGIFEGDLLAVHRTQDVKDGQIVVARIEDEVTVKRWHVEKDIIQLLPENDEYAPILVDPGRKDFAIEGVAVGVMRNIH